MKQLLVKDVCKLPKMIKNTIESPIYECGYNEAIAEISALPVTMTKLDVDVLTIAFCLRVKSWCKQNNVEYVGDYLIAPVFENFLKDTICQRFGASTRAVMTEEGIRELLKKWEHESSTTAFKGRLFHSIKAREFISKAIHATLVERTK